MSKELGFANAIDFALVVESWTQEERRTSLDTFYRKSETRFLENEDVRDKNEVKHEVEKQHRSESLDTKFMAKNEEFEDNTIKDPIKTENIHSEPSDEQNIRERYTESNNELVDSKDTSPLSKIKGEEAKSTIKEEHNTKAINTGGHSRRISIFLSDDDDDDEL